MRKKKTPRVSAFFFFELLFLLDREWEKRERERDSLAISRHIDEPSRTTKGLIEKQNRRFHATIEMKVSKKI